MALAKSRVNSESGFSLIEVLVAAVVFMVGVVALAQLFAISTRSNMSARFTTSTMVLAQQKMEQLRGLTWGFDVLNLPLSDTSTDLSVQPVTAFGRGLLPSPPNTLTSNVPGYVDYLDQYGRWLGTGGRPPQATVYIRRWSVEPLPANPNNTLILQVLVTRSVSRGPADNAGSTARLPDEARLVSVKTRKTV